MASRQRSLGGLAKLARYQVNVDRGGTRAQVIIPGFSLNDFDKTGSLSVTKTQMLMSSARIYAYHAPVYEGKGFLEYDKMTSDRFTFMASVQTEFSKDFYELNNIKQSPPEFGVDLHIGYIGVSSLNTVAVLKTLDNQTELVRNTNQVVSVDKSTRKPFPLPQWWVDKYKDAIVENKRIVIPTLSVSDNTFEHEIKVRWSDTDAYGHVNYISYVTFCMEAAMHAIVKSYFSKFSGDILLYKLRKMDIAFRGESLMDENLQVKTWEDPDDPWNLHFDISREEKTLFQCTLQYYPEIAQCTVNS